MPTQNTREDRLSVSSLCRSSSPWRMASNPRLFSAGLPFLNGNLKRTGPWHFYNACMENLRVPCGVDRVTYCKIIDQMK